MRLEQLEAGKYYHDINGEEFFFVGFMSDGFGVAEWDSETVEYFGEEAGPFTLARMDGNTLIADAPEIINDLIKRVNALEKKI